MQQKWTCGVAYPNCDCGGDSSGHSMQIKALVPDMHGMHGMQGFQEMQGMQGLPAMHGMQEFQEIQGMQGMQDMQYDAPIMFTDPESFNYRPTMMQCSQANGRCMSGMSGMEMSQMAGMSGMSSMPGMMQCSQQGMSGVALCQQPLSMPNMMQCGGPQVGGIQQVGGGGSSSSSGMFVGPCGPGSFSMGGCMPDGCSASGGSVGGVSGNGGGVEQQPIIPGPNSPLEEFLAWALAVPNLSSIGAINTGGSGGDCSGGFSGITSSSPVVGVGGGNGVRSRGNVSGGVGAGICGVGTGVCPMGCCVISNGGGINCRPGQMGGGVGYYAPGWKHAFNGLLPDI